jgi:pimeloyl-ACP methyl ester carboxylesterase
MTPDAYTNSWQSGGDIKRLAVTGGTIRYLEIGSGEPLLLMHTLRTQLDYFELLIPLLQQRYRIIAPDLPGYGYSPAADGARIDEPFFRGAVLDLMERLDLRNVTMVGESIGGVVALTAAATVPGRINHVIALNPYDYGDKFGGGIRNSRYGWVIGSFAVFGRYTPETPRMLRAILSGGLADPAKLPAPLVAELVRAGRQKGFRRTEYLLFKHWRSWLDAAELYGKVDCPVTLVYGERDWSKPEDRRLDRTRLPGARVITIPATGHFSALESARAVAGIIAGAPNGNADPHHR